VKFLVTFRQDGKDLGRFRTVEAASAARRYRMIYAYVAPEAVSRHANGKPIVVSGFSLHLGMTKEAA
jgi:hypothetical protein